MDRKSMRRIIRENEDCKANVCLILLETMAFRFVIFKQMFKIRYKSKQKKWITMTYEDKLLFVKEVFIPYYEEDYLNGFLVRAITQLKISKNYRYAFEAALFEIGKIENE